MLALRTAPDTMPMSSTPQLTPSTYHRLAFGPAYGLTDIGTVRQSNQDNFLIDPALGIVAVADGMGGHERGEVAAWLALRALQGALAAADPAPAARGAGDDADPHTGGAAQNRHVSAIVAAHRAVDAANAEVYEANVRAGHAEGDGMGTTLTGFWQAWSGGPLVVFHVGDSRLYRLRAGELALLTRDQSLYQQALEAGITQDYPPRNLLLQAIGPTDAVLPDVSLCPLLPGDVYLLCSDGLHGVVPDAAIAQQLQGANARTLDRCCAALVALAKQYGSRDNITAVLALAG